MNSPAKTSKTVKRLWLAGGALAAFVLTCAVGNAFLPDDKRLTARTLGHDFLAFYTAGDFVRTGRPHDLYDLPKVKAFQHDLARREGLEIGQSFGPFWNPPFYAWPFAPISALPYRQALYAWWGINGIALIGALFLLTRILRVGVKHEEVAAPLPRLHPSSPDLRTAPSTFLLPLLLVTSMPFIQAFSHGQNTFTSLALLTAAVVAWRAERPVVAGAVAGLLMYKPQLGAVVALALALSLGWRAVLGLAITGAALAGVTLFTLPGVLADYQRLLPLNLHEFQVENVYLWDRHVTLRAFWRLLVQGREAGEMVWAAKLLWLDCCALITAGLIRAWWAARRSPCPATRDGLIASVVVAMPLLMPFYFDYDLLLLALPATLCARVALASGDRARPLFWTWVGLFAWVMVNSSVARVSGVNGTVVLLCALEALLIRQTLAAARAYGASSVSAGVPAGSAIKLATAA